MPISPKNALVLALLFSSLFQSHVDASRHRKDRHHVGGRLKPSPTGPVPSIDRLDPAGYEFEIPHAASGHYPATIALTVYGTRFQPGATVSFDKVAVPTTFFSSTQLVAIVPFALLGKVDTAQDQRKGLEFRGKAWITVRNPGTRGATSQPKGFAITEDPIE